MSKVINFEEWRNENEVLMDPLIDAVPYLRLTLRYALEAIGFRYTRKVIKKIQANIKHNDPDAQIDETGIVDLNTFAYIIMGAYSEYPATLNAIKEQFDKIIDEFEKLKNDNPEKPQEELFNELNEKLDKTIPSDE